MKRVVTIIATLLGMLAGVLSNASASKIHGLLTETDSLIVNRIFDYSRNFVYNDVRGLTTTLYTKYTYDTWKRNFTLYLIPSMHSIAEGERSFVSESYGRIRFNAIDDYETHLQVYRSTIRHNRRSMPTLREFVAPNLYGVQLFKDHMLSPFNRENHHYYTYAVVPTEGGGAIVTFKPRFGENTQLVTGVATVDVNTGRIKWAKMSGEYDMIRFKTVATLGDEGTRSLLPKRSRTEAEFAFAGNRVLATFEGVLDYPSTLPDSLEGVESRDLMDQVRPTPLTGQEEYVYKLYDDGHQEQADTAAADSAAGQRRTNFFNDVLRHGIGDNLVRSLRYSDEHSNIRLWPILNPQYISYSHRRGLAYKMRLGANYYFNAHRYFEFNPWMGYNFKFKKFYFTIPLRFNYNPKRNGYVEVVYGNGNRTGHSSVVNEIIREHTDTVRLDGMNLELFDDYHLTATNNIMVFDWLDIEGGFSYHRRRAYNPDGMRLFGKPVEYRSYSPVLSVKLRPWRRGPLFTVDYERGIKGINGSTMDFERWEADASIKHKINPVKKINMRLGGGVYTRRHEAYFVDFSNFRDNNLPEGWDDDWTGDFQLLNSEWYNASRYYARTNFSYESPLLLASFLPVVGKHFEKERVYLSALSIDNTRPYYEIGYGFTTRFFSIGLFTSFLSAKFKDFECKFTIELFRRW